MKRINSLRQTAFGMAFAACLALAACAGCNDEPNQPDNPSGSDTGRPAVQPAVNAPDFNADTAYSYVAKQVGFGPRTPGSKSQLACAAWMRTELSTTTDTVYEQRITMRGGDGKSLPCINLIGAINPQATQRVLLLAHWDSRPRADQDTARQNEPIDAADDGGSGVAVLLELARVLRAHPLPQSMGVDILLVDVEDYGRTEWGDSSYGLGTQYWATHPHVPGYKAQYGILLDMVGARGAVFPLEQTSKDYAGDVQRHIWDAAGRAGYSSFFLFKNGGGITDDHTFVNDLTGIPTVDIIHLRDDVPNSVFAPHWHTHNDNLSIIDRATLKAVGQTVLQVLFETAAQGS